MFRIAIAIDFPSREERRRLMAERRRLAVEEKQARALAYRDRYRKRYPWRSSWGWEPGTPLRICGMGFFIAVTIVFFTLLMVEASIREDKRVAEERSNETLRQEAARKAVLRKRAKEE